MVQQRRKVRRVGDRVPVAFQQGLGLAQLLPTGTQLGLDVGYQRGESNSFWSTLNPYWGGDLSWGNVNLQAEQEFSSFHFEAANTDVYFGLFQSFEAEAKAMIDRRLVLPAYDYVAKLSHMFNILDARGAISVTERTGYIGRIRTLARRVALAYIEKREELGFPLAGGGAR